MLDILQSVKRKLRFKSRIRFFYSEFFDAAQKNGFFLSQNSKSLRRLSNIHRGKNAVIIGMGPSLRPEDLDRLAGYVSFACNKIYLAFDKTRWRPDYYTVIDILVAKNNKAAILDADFGNTLPIHSDTVWDYLSDQRSAIHYAYDGSIAAWHAGDNASLRHNLANGLFAYGYSVVIDQIQLAYAMGCQNVYLVGIDFVFSGGAVTGQNSISGQVLRSEGERNHFHPDYRRPGETWTVPRLLEQAHAFSFCRKAFEASGRKLYNASRVSALDVLERVDFDSTFSK